MTSAERPIVFLELIDPAEASALGGALRGYGMEVVGDSEKGADLGTSDAPAASPGDLDEAISTTGAEFLVVDGRLWPGFGVDLRHPPKAYLIVVLLDRGEEARAELLIQTGIFDCVFRSGPDWVTEAASYLKALIAVRRRFTTSLGALERRYEDLVHALPDVVYELDAAGRITFVNNSVRLLGYEPAELAGKHFSSLLYDEDAKVVDREAILDLFRGLKTGPALSPKLFNERRGLDRRTQNLELRLKRKEPLPMMAGREGRPAAAGTDDLIGSVIAYGEVTAAGEWAQGEDSFLGTVGIIRDITLRRKSEEMLRKLYQAVDQLSSGLLVSDRSFTVEYVNPAFLRMSGLEPQEVLGKSIFSFFELTEGRSAEIAALVRDGFEVREELPLHLASGDSLWTALHASPVRGPLGEVSHAIAICDNVSQRRAMEELLTAAKDEAERANRAKSDFLASMGHELKSPVASILSAARLIHMGGPEPEKRAAAIIASAQGLLELLGDILDFVRFETGSVVLRRYSFPLAGFLARACEPYRLLASDRELGFELAPVPDCLVHTDPDRLGRAISALLSNALAFTEKGRIRVEAALEHRSSNVPHLVLSVADTGIGIAPEDQGRIFAPFVQLASPFTKAGGAGIGLSLAHHIIRALGGEIRLQSEPGKGSLFTILLPVGEVEAIAAQEPSGAESFRLLVVDDNEVNLEYMAAILRNAGHRVEVASSGAEALRLLEARLPDAAILDIQMPGMSGIDLGRRIRSYLGGRYDPNLPLIALTAFDPEEVLRSGVDFDGVYSKPADISLLLNHLRGLVAAREAEARDSFGRRWAGREGAGASLLAKALAELPELWEELARAGKAGEREAGRQAAQTIAQRVADLGADRIESLLHRLALASTFEDSAVLAARARRAAALWERFVQDAQARLAELAGDTER